MKYITFWQICFVCFCLAGCSKESSNRWMNADVFVSNAADNKPLVTKVELHFARKVAWGYNVTVRDMGWTSEDGKLHIEEQIPANAVQCELHVYRNLANYKNKKAAFIERNISKKMSNKIVVKL